MKKNILLFSIVCSFSSCAVMNNHGVKQGSLWPDRVELRMTLDDVDLLGTSEISYEFSRYGIWPIYTDRLISMNDEPVNNGDKHFVNLLPKNYSYVVYSPFGRYLSVRNKKLQRALYKAYIDFPQADYFEPIVETTRFHRMFLGRKVTKSLKVNAYKIKL